MLITKNEVHWSLLWDERVRSTVHCKTGDNILVVTSNASQAIPALFSERFKAKFNDDSGLYQFTRKWDERDFKLSDDEERANYDMFAYLNVALGTYQSRYASDYSMEYDKGTYPTSVNYVLNLDTLAKKGIKVLGHDHPYA